MTEKGISAWTDYPFARLVGRYVSRRGGMTDREGPRAEVIFYTCDGCKHYAPNFCTKANRAVEDGLYRSWCPFHPGQVVAVVVPDKAVFGNMKDAWNDCRAEIIASARKLGQTVEGE